MRSKIFQDVIDETPEDVEIFVRWYAQLVLRINEVISEKGITKKSLAESMGKQPSEIHKWLNGGHNFTLRSLAKLQAELKVDILEISGQHKKHTEQVYPVQTADTTTYRVYRSTQHKKISFESCQTASIVKMPVSNVG